MNEELSPLELSLQEDERELAELQEGKEPQTDSEEVVNEALEEDPPEEEQEEEPIAAEAEEEEEAEEDDEPKGNQAFAKMRTSNKALEEQNRLMVERLATLEGVVQGQQSVQPQTQAEDPDPMPDKELDREDYLDWKTRQLENKIALQQQSLDQRELESQVNKVRSAMDWEENKYKEVQKDYSEAKAHLWAVEKQRVKMTYPNATDADIEGHLNQTYLQTCSDVSNRGINPAKYIYDQAKAVGYKEAASKQTQTKSNIGKIKENKRKSASLNGVGAVDGSVELTAEQVINMASSDVNLTDAQWKKIEEQASGG